MSENIIDAIIVDDTPTEVIKELDKESPKDPQKESPKEFLTAKEYAELQQKQYEIMRQNKIQQQNKEIQSFREYCIKIIDKSFEERLHNTGTTTDTWKIRIKEDSEKLLKSQKKFIIESVVKKLKPYNTETHVYKVKPDDVYYYGWAYHLEISIYVTER